MTAPHLAGYRIEGHAIVSADDCIADASGQTPAELANDADWRRFQAALDEAAVVLLGRLSHEANPNTAGRNRLVVSSRANGVERRADGWWWNPANARLAVALKSAAPEGGIVAVPGGHLIFDMLLAGPPGFDAFHLARATRVSIPGGVPVFSAIAEGQRAEDILAAHGLFPGALETIDPAGITLTVWRRLA